jgi:cardiolipin synthase
MFQAVHYRGRRASPSNSILQHLAEARRRGVQVRVVLDDGGSLPEVAAANAGAAALLKKAGVEVYADSPAATTHAKVIVVDGETAVLGSTNWTYSALARNHEVNAVIRSRAFAARLLDYFESVRGAGKQF